MSPPRLIVVSALIVCACAQAQIVAGEAAGDQHPTGDATDASMQIARLLNLMPRPTVPMPQRTTLPAQGFVNLDPMVAMLPGKQVKLEGLVLFDQGPVDGLEVLACLEGGKLHEAFIRLLCGNAEMVKSAFIAALDLRDGVVAPEAYGQPARGTPLRVLAYWQPDPLLEPEAWVRLDVSCLVRDRGLDPQRPTDRAYPPLPWIYTGSQIREVGHLLPDGKEVTVKRFMLASTRSLAVNYDEPDALLASPFPLAAVDNCFEVNSALAPHANSRIFLVFERVGLPLVLVERRDGVLLLDGRERNDDELREAIKERFSSADRDLMRVIGVVAGAEVERALDVTTRLRLLRLAGEAGVWAVPVFLIPEAAAGS